MAPAHASRLLNIFDKKTTDNLASFTAKIRGLSLVEFANILFLRTKHGEGSDFDDLTLLTCACIVFNEANEAGTLSWSDITDFILDDSTASDATDKTVIGRFHVQPSNDATTHGIKGVLHATHFAGEKVFLFCEQGPMAQSSSTVRMFDSSLKPTGFLPWKGDTMPMYPLMCAVDPAEKIIGAAMSNRLIVFWEKAEPLPPAPALTIRSEKMLSGIWFLEQARMWITSTAEHDLEAWAIQDIMRQRVRTYAHETKVETTDFRPTSCLHGHQGIITCVVEIANHDCFASCGLDALVFLWDRWTHKTVGKINSPVSGVRSMDYNPYYDLLIMGGFDMHAVLISPKKGTTGRIGKLKGHTAPLVAVQFLKNEPTACVTADTIGVVYIWDVRTMDALQVISPDKLGSFNVLTQMDGDIIVGGARTQRITCAKNMKQTDDESRSAAKKRSVVYVGHNVINQRLYVVTKEEIYSWGLQPVTRPRGPATHVLSLSAVDDSFPADEISCACFDGTQRRLLIGTDQGRVIVMHARNGRLLGYVRGHTSGISHIVYGSPQAPLRLLQNSMGALSRGVIVSATYGGQLVVHSDNLDMGFPLLYRLLTDSRPLCTVQWTPTGLVSATDEGMTWWNLRGGKVRHHVHLPTVGAVPSVSCWIHPLHRYCRVDNCTLTVFHCGIERECATSISSPSDEDKFTTATWHHTRPITAILPLLVSTSPLPTPFQEVVDLLVRAQLADIGLHHADLADRINSLKACGLWRREQESASEKKGQFGDLIPGLKVAPEAGDVLDSEELEQATQECVRRYFNDPKTHILAANVFARFDSLLAQNPTLDVHDAEPHHTTCADLERVLLWLGDANGTITVLDLHSPENPQVVAQWSAHPNAAVEILCEIPGVQAVVSANSMLGQVYVWGGSSQWGTIGRCWASFDTNALRLTQCVVPDVMSYPIFFTYQAYRCLEVMQCQDAVNATVDTYHKKREQWKEEEKQKRILESQMTQLQKREHRKKEQICGKTLRRDPSGRILRFIDIVDNTVETSADHAPASSHVSHDTVVFRELTTAQDKQPQHRSDNEYTGATQRLCERLDLYDADFNKRRVVGGPRRKFSGTIRPMNTGAFKNAKPSLAATMGARMFLPKKPSGLELPGRVKHDSRPVTSSIRPARGTPKCSRPVSMPVLNQGAPKSEPTNLRPKRPWQIALPSPSERSARQSASLKDLRYMDIRLKIGETESRVRFGLKRMAWEERVDPIRMEEYVSRLNTTAGQK